MTKIWVSFNKFDNENAYKWTAISEAPIENAIWVEITQDVINEIQDMLNETK